MSKEQRVEAVERALTILGAFSDGTRRLSLADLSDKTGFYRSTILRLSASLERFGYLVRDDDGYFYLGATLLHLGSLYQSGFNLSDHIRPALARISEATNQTAAFYVREGDRRVCLYRHHSKQMILHFLEEGAVLSLEGGASARVLLAFSGEKGELYDKIRKDRWYLSRGERDPDTSAISVPVFSAAGVLIGALSCSGLRRHFDDRDTNSRFAAVMSEESAALRYRIA